ncbi:MAG: DUF2336 domain-containing protein [Rhodospirillaceae bacterium]|nr:DUF2336 domain-containing protein [Rhodospirillaceae bacterium]
MSPAKARLIHLLGLPGHKITYEQARDLLDHPDVEVRCALAQRDDLEPEILFFLARDVDPTVRRIIASNTKVPEKASLVLASDADGDVRAELAMRLGKLIPGFDAADADKTWRTVHQVLALLVRDQLPRVRRVISEALKYLPDAPRDIVLQLARDPEVSVAAPILEFSPVLTDQDLIDIIESSPLTASLVAISRRLNVGEEVSNAIVGTADVDAITALLNNQSAQIREATLDAIIDAAPVYPSWHEPLVTRRQLPGRAALRIAGFVADTLLQKLAARQDLDAATTSALGLIVKQKLNQDSGSLAPDSLSAALDPIALRTAAARAAGLMETGKLTPVSIMKIAQDGVSTVIIAALAARANLPVDAVAEVVRSGSAKGMLAVAWAGDFTADQAEILQLKVARVMPDQVIKPKSDGWFDATEAEMEWQLNMFKDAAQQNATDMANASRRPGT